MSIWDLRTSSSYSSGESGETTSISDSEGSDSTNEETSNPSTIDLTLERLQALHALGTVKKKDLTDYAKRGLSTKRIKTAALKPKCTCMCKMPVKMLYQLCCAFWTLCKPAQDCLLWEIQHTGDAKKKRWFLAGPLPFDSTSTPCASIRTLYP